MIHNILILSSADEFPTYFFPQWDKNGWAPASPKHTQLPAGHKRKQVPFLADANSSIVRADRDFSSITSGECFQNPNALMIHYPTSHQNLFWAILDAFVLLPRLNYISDVFVLSLFFFSFLRVYMYSSTYTQQ